MTSPPQDGGSLCDPNFQDLMQLQKENERAFDMKVRTLGESLNKIKNSYVPNTNMSGMP